MHISKKIQEIKKLFANSFKRYREHIQRHNLKTSRTQPFVKIFNVLYPVKGLHLRCWTGF